MASNFWTKELLVKLNTTLEKQSYISGPVEPSACDKVVLRSLEGVLAIQGYPHIQRWFKHIASFEVDKLPGEIKQLQQLVTEFSVISIMKVSLFLKYLYFSKTMLACLLASYA